MSIDLYLYCKKVPSKRAVENVIAPLGFEEREPLARGHYWYFWFEEKDLASMRGCHLFWERYVPGDDSWPGAPRDTKIVFTAKTYAARSHEDVDMQNNVIRQLRRRFGGSIYEEWPGRRGYIENDLPKLTYAEKRCGFVFVDMQRALWRIAQLPADPSGREREQSGVLEEHGIPGAPRAIIQNNVLLPYLVAAIENFLRQFFIAFVDSHPDLSEHVYERQGKLEYSTLRALLEAKVTLAEHEASNYSFQSLDSANVAFERYVGIKLLRIWGQRKKFNGKFFVVRDVLQDLLNLRHRIIHQAYIEPGLGKDQTLRYIRFVEHALQIFADHLERAKGFRIDLEKHL